MKVNNQLLDRIAIFLNFAYHRIRMEGMVLDEPRGVKAPGVHDKPRSSQIAQVAV